MSEPVLSGTASAHSLTKDPSEFKRRTYQDILEKDSKLGGAFPETNEKVALENGDREKSRRCRFLYIPTIGLFIFITTRSREYEEDH